MLASRAVDAAGIEHGEDLHASRRYQPLIRTAESPLAYEAGLGKAASDPADDGLVDSKLDRDRQVRQHRLSLDLLEELV